MRVHACRGAGTDESQKPLFMDRLTRKMPEGAARRALPRPEEVGAVAGQMQEAMHRVTLEARRDVLGARHPDTMDAIYSLTYFLSGKGRLEEAAPLYREALEALREVLGARHTDTLGTMSNLKAMLKDQGKLDEAEPLCREALEGYREVKGSRHRITLIAVTNLAILLHD